MRLPIHIFVWIFSSHFYKNMATSNVSICNPVRMHAPFVCSDRQIWSLSVFHRFPQHFCDNWIPFSNVCYAFLDYLPALQTDIRRICHTYRLAEPSVMRIPYNIRFREAVRSGQSHDYLKEELPQYKTTDFHLCIQELTRSGKLILKTLDENLLIRSNGFKNVHHI